MYPLRNLDVWVRIIFLSFFLDFLHEDRSICACSQVPSSTVSESWLSTVASMVRPSVPGTICFQPQRKLCSGPEQVRRLALPQADLCCQWGAWDPEFVTQQVGNWPQAAVALSSRVRFLGRGVKTPEILMLSPSPISLRVIPSFRIATHKS